MSDVEGDVVAQVEASPGEEKDGGPDAPSDEPHDNGGQIELSVMCTPGWLRVTEGNKNDYVDREYFVPRRDIHHKLELRADGLFNCMMLINAVPSNFDDETNGPYYVENSHALVKGIKNLYKSTGTGLGALATKAAEQHVRNVKGITKSAFKTLASAKKNSDKIVQKIDNVQPRWQNENSTPEEIESLHEIIKSTQSSPKDKREAKERLSEITNTPEKHDKNQTINVIITNAVTTQLTSAILRGYYEENEIPDNLLNYKTEVEIVPLKGKPVLKLASKKAQVEYVGTLNKFTDDAKRNSRLWSFTKDGIEHREYSRSVITNNDDGPLYFVVNGVIDESVAVKGGKTRRFRHRAKHYTHRRVVGKTRRTVEKKRTNKRTTRHR
jgi:hypothetical protein